ncbi:MAG: hypothetical protein P8Y14_27705, partial [Anaerolineales bacterium]
MLDQSIDQQPKTSRAVRIHVGRDDADRIQRVWVAGEMIVILAVIVLFNFFPDKVGVLVSLTDPQSFIPLLAPEFMDHLAWLNLWWGLALLLAGAKLIIGRWRTAMRWAEIGLQFFAGFILFRLVMGGPIVGINSAWAGAVSGFWADQVIPVLNVSAKIALS